MTIPVPRVKYNLVPSEGATSNSSEYSKTICLSGVLLFLLIIPLISLFAFNFFILHNIEGDDNDYYYSNRAEIYSADEYINRNSGCKFCDVPGKTQAIDTPANTYKLVCYYNIPETPSDSSALLPEDIECNLCTHINVAFASIFNNSLLFNEDMKNITSRVLALKTCNNNLKVLISVGGGSPDEGFANMVVNHASRKLFIKSIKEVLFSMKLDGIDLDWEFPAVGTNMVDRVMGKKTILYKRQRQHFSQLLREIRSEYIREKKDYILSVAVAAPESIVNVAYDVGEINKYADYINLMTYDLHFYTKYTPLTGFNAPLYSRKEEHFYMATLNINYTANLWLEKGMDRNKIVVGLPTYGHSFTLVSEGGNRPGSPAKGYGQLGTLGFVDFKEVCHYIHSKNVKVTFDNETSSPYFTQDLEWVSYEDKQSLIEKTKYIRNSEFGGVMIYSLNNDDYSGSCSKDKANKFYLTQHVSDTLFDDEL